jgi:hypothetical protein
MKTRRYCYVDHSTRLSYIALVFILSSHKSECISLPYLLIRVIFILDFVHTCVWVIEYKLPLPTFVTNALLYKTLCLLAPRCLPPIADSYANMSTISCFSPRCAIVCTRAFAWPNRSRVTRTGEFSPNGKLLFKKKFTNG